MDSQCYFAFIYSNLFVPVRTPIKTKCGDKQWKRCHLLLARAFIFHIIKCFHQWSSAHSFNSVNHDPDHIAMVGGENPMCCLYKREKERERKTQRKEGRKKGMFLNHLFPLTLQTGLWSFMILHNGCCAPK